MTDVTHAINEVRQRDVPASQPEPRRALDPAASEVVVRVAHEMRKQLSAVRVIEHTWHSALITWLSGRASIAQVKIDIETVCRLIDLTDPAAPGKPS